MAAHYVTYTTDELPEWRTRELPGWKARDLPEVKPHLIKLGRPTSRAIGTRDPTVQVDVRWMKNSRCDEWEWSFDLDGKRWTGRIEHEQFLNLPDATSNDWLRSYARSMVELRRRVADPRMQAEIAERVYLAMRSLYQVADPVGDGVTDDTEAIQRCGVREYENTYQQRRVEQREVAQATHLIEQLIAQNRRQSARLVELECELGQVRDELTRYKTAHATYQAQMKEAAARYASDMAEANHMIADRNDLIERMRRDLIGGDGSSMTARWPAHNRERIIHVQSQVDPDE